jgi:glutathione S-transferase
MRQLELYYSPGSASFVVHWLLIELSLPHKLMLLDTANKEHKQPAYLAINPAGLVPTLVADGAPITEAAAICLHLADSTRQLCPEYGTHGHAQLYQWMFFCANTLQPQYRRWFYPNEDLGDAHIDLVKEAARKHIEAAWDRVDQHLQQSGPYLLGTELSVADFMLAMLMRWSRNMPKPAHAWPAVARLAALMKTRPSFKKLYEVEALTEWL